MGEIFCQSICVIEKFSKFVLGAYYGVLCRQACSSHCNLDSRIGGRQCYLVLCEEIHCWQDDKEFERIVFELSFISLTQI